MDWRNQRNCLLLLHGRVHAGNLVCNSSGGIKKSLLTSDDRLWPCKWMYIMWRRKLLSHSSAEWGKFLCASLRSLFKMWVFFLSRTDANYTSVIWKRPAQAYTPRRDITKYICIFIAFSAQRDLLSTPLAYWTFILSAKILSRLQTQGGLKSESKKLNPCRRLQGASTPTYKWSILSAIWYQNRWKIYGLIVFCFCFN